MINMKRNRSTARAVASFWGKDLDDKSWFSMKQNDNGTAQIRIYDVIGWPFIEAGEFAKELDAIEADKIEVKINTPGGDVFDGTAIYNMLNDHPAQISTKIEGIAASMGSIIALAGDKGHREISKTSQYMIHNPSSLAWGDYRTMSETAEFLRETIGDPMVQLYTEVTGKEPSEIQSLMDNESWFTGQKAVDSGFIDKVVGQSQSTARFNLSVFENAPEENKEINKRTIEQVLTRDAGLTRSQARKLMANGLDSIDMPDAISETEQAAKNLLEILKD